MVKLYAYELKLLIFNSYNLKLYFVNNKMFQCSYCKKEFSRQYNLDRHLTVCKMNTDNPIICSTCNKEYKTIKRYNIHIEKCKKQDLTTLKKKKLEKDIELTECKIKAIKNKLKKSNTTVTNNTYVQNNINIYGLEPLDLSQQRFNTIVNNKYTYDSFVQYKLVKDVIIPFFSNDEGKVCAQISDRSRVKVKCIDKDKGIVYHDPVTIVGICKNSEPLQEKNDEYFNKKSRGIHGEVIEAYADTALCMVEQSRNFNVMKNNLKKNINNFIDKTQEQKKEVIIRFIE